MKEERFFYAPDAAGGSTIRLSDDEAQHAVRVLRLTEGDEVWAMDGHGSFYRCEIAIATRKACELSVLETLPQTKTWRGRLTLAIAPTKNIDRMEWLVEKAVEIGVDRIVPLLAQNSERTALKTERLERIAVSAMKQSRKPWATEIAEMTRFEEFLTSAEGNRYIAHCHNDMGKRQFMLDTTDGVASDDRVVMIGPEGDFSQREVELAIERGFVPISLGESRLRTETAGLVAVHFMSIMNRK